MKELKNTVLFICFLLITSPLLANDYQASTFGIKSDGITMNTRSIQKAIDYISATGGGMLKFYVGRYLTGSIHLKSNVTIYLGEGAVLVGSTNPYDYDQELNNWYGLILANGQENIAIIGKGVIDGQGRILANNFLHQVQNGIIKDELGLDRVSNRPMLLYLRSCKNVTIEGITLTNASFWTDTYDQCQNLRINKITVNSTAYWNNDGMDIVDCNGALITDCYISSSDDAICLKSHDEKSLCQNIEIRNCVARSGANGIKLGTASTGGFKHIKIINNIVYDTFRSAITVQAVDGGQVENITIDSLHAVNVGNPIYLVVGERRTGHRSRMDNIHISNVYVEVPATKPDAGYDYEGPVEGNPRNISPSSIIGLADNKITNITIKNVEIVYPGGGDTHIAKVGLDELDKVKEMPKSYPEFSQHKELPAWGFYIRHADNVVFKNVKLTAKKKDYRPAIVLDDVDGGVFTGTKFNEPDSKKKVEIFTYKSDHIKK
ncbi:MAG: glycosyl hydrolase family 28 protein [Massilibacteroides sp.]|nr:glycosyl hydrolase family 28 protein [Massilibacteroides sp.]